MNREYLSRMTKFGHMRNEVFDLVKEYQSNNVGLRYDSSLDSILYGDKRLIEFELGMIAGIKIHDTSKISKDISSRLVEIGFCIVN